jgi:hypothetical protein
MQVKPRPERAAEFAFSELIGRMKGSSCKRLKEKGVQGFAWQNGYGAFSVSQSDAEAAILYLTSQAEPHRKCRGSRGSASLPTCDADRAGPRLYLANGEARILAIGGSSDVILETLVHIRLMYSFAACTSLRLTFSRMLGKRTKMTRTI